MPLTVDAPTATEQAAWIAAAVGTAITVVQLPFNVLRERRLRRQEQARFGYELVDQLFDSDSATRVLYALDSGKWKGPQSPDAHLREDFFRAFGKEFDAAEQAQVDARLKFDAVLYYFDRMQHAIDAGLTRFEDVQAPLAWYAGLLSPCRTGISAYANMVHYQRAVRLLAQFPEWSS